MAILEKEVWVGLSSGTSIKHFEFLNYEIPRTGKHVKRGTKIKVKIEDLQKGCNVKITKVCDDCGNLTKNTSYNEVIKRREIGDGKDRCFKCGKKKASVTRIKNVDYEKSLECYAKVNNLNYLLAEFSTKNDAIPKYISYGSNKDFWWDCPKCKSEYDMQMAKRTLRGFQCPFCQGRRVNDTNSLAKLRPEIAREWHSLKNGEATPHSVVENSNKTAWWICPKCKSDYKSAVSTRVSGVKCPYCVGIRVNHTNCLANKDPHLASEWHPTKNGKLTPADVTCKGSRKVWWKCKHGHEWKTSLAHRSVERTGCPHCAESKGEKRVRIWLEENNIEFEPQKEFEGLVGTGGRNLSYDFYLPLFNTLIEYQGLQHEQYVKGLHVSKDNFKKQQEHDKRKSLYANANDIKLLEIWYWDFDSIESILYTKLVINEEEFNVIRK